MKTLTPNQKSIIESLNAEKGILIADEEQYKAWVILGDKKQKIPYSTYLAFVRNGMIILKKHFKDIPLDCMTFEYSAL